MDTPLDYSFFEIADMTDILEEKPRPQLKKTVQKVATDEVNEDNEPIEKYQTRCLRLNNNLLAELTGFMSVLEQLLVEPNILTWVDISFNEMTKISACLCDLPELQILYLHGNSINDIDEVDKLIGIPKLQKLTLHGNPIENAVKNYRWHILSLIPHLRNFDMSAITKSDRATAITWKKSNPKKKKKKPSEA